MAWAKSIRNILGTHSSDNSRPEFFEEKTISLLEASSLSAIRNEGEKASQNKLLVKKLRLCSQICDFRLADTGDDVEKQKIFNKTSILHEICTYLKTATDWHSLEVITQIFDTVSKNLFRAIPDSYLKQHLMGVDHIVPITYTIASWQHIEIIYEIIELTFNNSQIDQLLLTEYIKKYDFIKHFVHLLNTKDKNERHHIQSVLETFYNEHGNIFEKELILHLVHYCMDFIYYQIGTATGIKSILNIFNSMSLIDLEIYNKILIPLHKMEYKYFRRYEFVLWIYCKRIIEEDEHLSLILFAHLLHFWPITNPLKEQQFLKKIAIILDFVDEEIWNNNINEKQNPKQFELFRSVAYKILYCLQNANHYKTIIDILDIIEQEEVQEFIDIYGGQQLWCCIYQSLYDIITYFFYFETVKKTKETVEILREQDDIPMKYLNVFHKIDTGKFRMYPLNITAFREKKSEKMVRKCKERQKYYVGLTKKAHATRLYKKVQKQKETEKKQRILQEKKRKKEKEKKELLRKRMKYTAPQSQSQSRPPPVPVAKPPKKSNTKQRSAHNIAKIFENLSPKLSAKHSHEEKKNNSMPQMSLYNNAPPQHIKPVKYNIIPKKKPKSEIKTTTTTINPNPKSFFRKSRSSDNVMKELSRKISSPSKKHAHKFWSRDKDKDRDRPSSPKLKNIPKRVLPKLNKSTSERLRMKKKEEKKEKQRLKAEKKAEKMRVKDMEKERKKEEKRIKKELKKREKEMKRATKNRIRKSIDIDRRTSDISNPVQPPPNSAAFNKYNQITNNNGKNHYLNTQYYVKSKSNFMVINATTATAINPNESNANNNKNSGNRSPKLQFSYSPNATYDPPNVPSISNNNNNNVNKFIYNNNNNNHTNNNRNQRTSPPNRNGRKESINRSKTPPPPKKQSGYGYSIAKAKPLDKSHPLHKNNKNKNVKKKVVLNAYGKNKNNNNSIDEKKNKAPTHTTNSNSGTRKKKLPPRPWPPVSSKST